MAELNPELPQVEATGGIGAVSPNLESISAVGRGMEKLGGTMQEASETFYRRNAQEENSQAYAAGADFREQKGEELSAAFQRGELDPEQFKQKMQDDASQLQDKLGLETAPAQNFFNRQMARTQGYMLQKASHLKAQLSANNAIDDYEHAGDTLSNVAKSDPAQFADLIDQNEEHKQAAIDAGLPAAFAPKLASRQAVKIADGAAKGWAEMDPGKDASGKPNPNLLTQMLAHKDENGKGPFDDYLSADHIAQLENYAKTQDSARRSQDEQDIRRQKDAEEKREKAVLTQIVPGIFDQSFKATDITKLGLPLPKAMEVLGAIHRVATEESPKQDPRLMNDLTQQINKGQITDEGQLLKHLGNGVDASGYKQLRGLIADTPEGESIKTNRARLLDIAKGKLVKDGGMMGLKDPDGEDNLNHFTQDLQNAEAQMRKDGKSPMELYQYGNPKYFLNGIGKYQQTPEQIMEKMAGGNTADMIRVKNKEGAMFTMPRSNLDKAKSKGYEEVK